MSHDVQQVEPEPSPELEEVVIVSVLEDMDEVITVLAFVTSEMREEYGEVIYEEDFTCPILAFKFRIAAIEAADILNDFLRENEWYYSGNEESPKDSEEIHLELVNKLTEMDFPTDKVIVGNSGCRFITYQLPLRD